MGFTEVLTIVFIVLKLTSVISWSWWLVLLPELIAFGLYLVYLAFFLIVRHKQKKVIKSWLDEI